MYQPFAEVTQHQIEVRITIEQTAHHQTNSMHCRFLSEAPGRADQAFVTGIDAARRAFQRFTRMQIDRHVQLVDLIPEYQHGFVIKIQAMLAIFNVGVAVDQRTFHA